MSTNAMEASRTRSLAGPIALVFTLALLDQIVKQVFEALLPLRTVVPVFGPLNWFLTYNEGVAFSMLSFMGSWGLVVLTGLILLLVLYLWSRTPRAHRFAWFGFALVAGGALGNLIDRALLGHVVDYVLLMAGDWSFAVFNLADGFITVGAVMVLVDEVFGWGRRRAEPS